jgi:hypothetical protein
MDEVIKEWQSILHENVTTNMQLMCLNLTTCAASWPELF